MPEKSGQRKGAKGAGKKKSPAKAEKRHTKAATKPSAATTRKRHTKGSTATADKRHTKRSTAAAPKRKRHT